MITMLWKELRENLKWAVLAMIGLGMAEFYALNQQQFFGFYVQEAAPLCKSSFLMITTFGCAAVGLVLGLVQLLPEQRRDQWAALIHRPVPRATIFRGKAVAGLMLYLAATVLPFIACVWYVAAPGHFAVPFTPRMIYPGVADICAGATYYFAALFVALHRGPWYGTRAFGLLAAVSASFFTLANVPFYVVVEANVFMSLALFTAAWGAMLSNGTLRAQPWLARFAVLAVVFYGVTVLGVFSDMIWNAFGRSQYYFGSQYIIDIDGRPLKMSTSKDGGNVFTDLSGNVVNDQRLKNGLGSRAVINLTVVTSNITTPHGPQPPERYRRGYRSSEEYIQSVYDANGSFSEVWYYVPHDRVFIGYNRYNSVRLGALGQNGFSPGEGPVQGFTEHLVDSRYYQIPNFARFGSVIDYLDYSQRTVTPVFSQPGEQIYGSEPLSPYGNDPDLKNMVIVALLHEVQIIDDKGKIVTRFPYHQDVDRWGGIQIAFKSITGPAFVLYSPSTWIPDAQRRTMPTYLEQVDLQGNMVKSYVLPPLPEVHFPRSWHTYLTDYLKTPGYFFGEMVYEKMGATLGSKRLAGDLHDRLAKGWGYTKDISIRISLFSLLLSVVTLFWARSRQFSWNRAWAWAGFVLAFNLAGLITFRLIADWPVLVKCPSCGRKRLVNEPTCAHCGAAWPVPPRDGTEIIEEQPALASR